MTKNYRDGRIHSIQAALAILPFIFDVYAFISNLVEGYKTALWLHTVSRHNSKNRVNFEGQYLNTKRRIKETFSLFFGLNK